MQVSTTHSNLINTQVKVMVYNQTYQIKEHMLFCLIVDQIILCQMVSNPPILLILFISFLVINLRGHQIQLLLYPSFNLFLKDFKIWHYNPYFNNTQMEMKFSNFFKKSIYNLYSLSIESASIALISSLLISYVLKYS